MTEKPSYVVPPKRKPSYLNATAGVGWAAGALATAVTGVPLLPVAGIVAGSYFGKKKMEQETAIGRTVTPPSGWNKGAFIGGVLGAMGPGVIAGLTTALAVGTGGAGLLAVGAVALVGAVIGSKINKHFQKKEYQRAEEYALVNGPYVPPQQQGLEQQHAMAQGVAPQQHHALPQQGQLQQASQQLDPQQLAQLQALAAQGQRMAPSQQETMVEKIAAQSRQQGETQR